MSALGQKQTFAVQNAMSALPPKADMCGATRYVRFVPKADRPFCRNCSIVRYRVGKSGVHAPPHRQCPPYGLSMI